MEGEEEEGKNENSGFLSIPAILLSSATLSHVTGASQSRDWRSHTIVSNRTVGWLVLKIIGGSVRGFLNSYSNRGAGNSSALKKMKAISGSVENFINDHIMEGNIKFSGDKKVFHWLKITQTI